MVRFQSRQEAKRSLNELLTRKIILGRTGKGCRGESKIGVKKQKSKGVKVREGVGEEKDVGGARIGDEARRPQRLRGIPTQTL